ncbi:45777_t:CDS:2 [Gigaspora margarita]|uniref:45777_t:CDS:1 n=1 Tax=Gigaspora margarita TaxID=4874 RepID=A0ABM8VZ84_GIGMA|nr:45777_t:CDS:2 [Gigaspora margarita]
MFYAIPNIGTSKSDYEKDNKFDNELILRTIDDKYIKEFK